MDNFEHISFRIIHILINCVITYNLNPICTAPILLTIYRFGTNISLVIIILFTIFWLIIIWQIYKNLKFSRQIRIFVLGTFACIDVVLSNLILAIGYCGGYINVDAEMLFIIPLIIRIGILCWHLHN